MKKERRGRVVRINELPTINYVSSEASNQYNNFGVLPVMKIDIIRDICQNSRMSRRWFRFPIPDELESFLLHSYDPKYRIYMFFGYLVRVDFFDTNVLIEILLKSNGLLKIEEVRSKLVSELKKEGYETKIVGDRKFIDVREGV